MDTDTNPAQLTETEADRQARIAWENERLAEARADVAAGRLVSSAKVKAWIDSIDTDHELPVPTAAADPLRVCRESWTIPTVRWPTSPRSDAG